MPSFTAIATCWEHTSLQVFAYMTHRSYPKPSGEIFYAVTIELPDDIYLVKIPVEIDSLDDVQKWLDAEQEGGAPDTEPEDNTLPDDNISQYKGEDDSDDE